MPGAPEPLYVLARRVLLDALEALGDQQDAVILVGAQAVYLHTGEADLAVAEYTTDGRHRDRSFGAQVGAEAGRVPDGCGVHPRRAGGRKVADHQADRRGSRHGQSRPPRTRGRRWPRPPGGQDRRPREAHGPEGKGLEAALLDWDRLEVGSLDETDDRRFAIKVAGPSALLVAKLHKIAGRVDTPGRAEDKDALDILRLLRAVPIERFAGGLRSLGGEQLSAGVTGQAIIFLRDLFGRPTSPGSEMASRAAAPLEDEDTIRESCAALASELLNAVAGR
jgi:hypothetical protein